MKEGRSLYVGSPKEGCYFSLVGGREKKKNNFLLLKYRRENTISPIPSGRRKEGRGKGDAFLPSTG